MEEAKSRGLDSYSRGSAVIWGGQVLSNTSERSTGSQEMRMINTDISQIPPVIREVDENASRQRRKKKKLHPRSALSQKRGARRIQERLQRPQLGSFKPVYGSNAEAGNQQIQVEADSNDFISEDLSSPDPLHKLTVRSLVKNQSIAHPELQELQVQDQVLLGASYNSHQSPSSLSKMLPDPSTLPNMRMKTYKEKELVKPVARPRRLVKNASYDDHTNSFKFQNPNVAVPKTPSLLQKQTKLTAGMGQMESILESKESVRSPTNSQGKTFQLDLQRLTTGHSGDPSSSQQIIEEEISDKVQADLQQLKETRQLRLNQLQNQTTNLTALNNEKSESLVVPKVGSETQIDPHKIEQQISLFSDEAGKVVQDSKQSLERKDLQIKTGGQISRKTKFVHAQSAKNSDIQNRFFRGKVLGKGFIPKFQSQARLERARESRIHQGVEASERAHRLQSTVFDFKESLRRPLSAANLRQTQLHRTAYQRLQVLNKKALMMREEQVQKKLLETQMVKFNLDMYSFDLPLQYEEGKTGAGFFKSGVQGKFLSSQQEIIVSSASGVGGRENQSQGSQVSKSSPVTRGRSDIASAQEKDDSRSQSSHLTKGSIPTKKAKEKEDPKKSDKKKGKKNTKAAKQKTEAQEPKKLTQEELEAQQVQKAMQERMEQQKAILYPEPSTKVFLNAVKMKLFASDSKSRSYPKTLVSKQHQQDSMLAIKMQQALSRQPNLQKNKELMNRDLIEFSGSATTLTPFVGIGSEAKQSTGALKQLSSKRVRDDQYQTPKFDRPQSASSSLNRDLMTVQKRPVRKAPPKLPPPTVKKYGIEINRKPEKMQSKETLYQIKERKENARQYGTSAVDGFGFKAKTKLPRKSKSIITMKNFGGKGTTTVFMRDNKPASFTHEQLEHILFCLNFIKNSNSGRNGLNKKPITEQLRKSMKQKKPSITELN